MKDEKEINVAVAKPETKRLVATCRYSAQVGPEDWAMFTDVKILTEETTAREVIEWARQPNGFLRGPVNIVEES